MSAEKTYRKLIPVDPLDMAEIETWLSDLAERGYLLIEFSSIFGLFKKGTPKKIRYRLEPVGEDVYFPEVERRQMYEDNGWKFIASCKKRFYVYKTEDAAAPELHTDPVVQSEALKSLERVQRRGLVALLSGVLWLAFLITLLAIRNRLFSGWLMELRIIDCLFITFWLMVAFIIPATTVVKIGRLRRGLRSGRHYDHRGSYKRAAVRRVAAGVLICAIVATTIASFAIDLNNTRYDYFPITNSAPASVWNLAEFGREIDPVLQEATVEYAVQASLFAPVQYIVSLSEPEAATDIASVENSPRLIISYYETAPYAIAGPLFNELVRHYCGSYGQKLPAEQLESVVYSQYDFVQNLVARSGDKVVVLRYFYGYSNLSDALQQVTGLLADSQPVS